MGLFSWLFGWKARKVDNAGEAPSPDREDRFIDLGQREQSGEMAHRICLPSKELADR